MSRRYSALVITLFCFCLMLCICDIPAAWSQSAPTRAGCAAIVAKTGSLPNVQITRSDLVANDAQYPAYCLVQGKVNERKGADGKTYAIGFEMRLPNAWNGRFLYQTNGGNDGVVVPTEGDPKNLGAVGRVTALSRGFAVLSTDAGHNGADPANANTGLLAGNMFGLDPQARSDYGYASIGAMVPVARSIIKAYYGMEPSHTPTCSAVRMADGMAWLQRRAMRIILTVSSPATRASIFPKRHSSTHGIYRVFRLQTPTSENHSPRTI